MLDASVVDSIKNYQVVTEIRLHPGRRYKIIKSLKCPNSKNICYNIKAEDSDRSLSVINPSYFRPRGCVLVE